MLCLLKYLCMLIIKIFFYVWLSNKLVHISTNGHILIKQQSYIYIFLDNLDDYKFDNIH